MLLRAGTSGYSYAEWRGPFYPDDLPTKELLRFYASRLPAVEINNTFYRLPRASVLASWAEQVPEGFRFSLKASRRITHFKRLKDVADETGYLVRTSATLGERLGVLLFQLPPNLACDLPRLEAFLELLPGGTRAAFEFRHPSWLEPRTFEALQARDCALVTVDGAGEPAPELVATASWGYLRLRGAAYPPAELAEWVRRVRARPWQETFVFFKHEDEGAGPRLAAQFLELAERAPKPTRGIRRVAREPEAG